MQRWMSVSVSNIWNNFHDNRVQNTQTVEKSTMFNIKKFKPKMDSYDEVHDVKNGRDIATPPGNLDDLERNGGGSSITQFTHSEEDEEEVKEDKKELTAIEVSRILLSFVNFKK